MPPMRTFEDSEVTDEAASSLTIPSPDSLSALFAADPLTLSDASLLALVRELRRRRSEFLSAEAATAAKGKKAKPAREPIDPTLLDKPPGEVNLDDLMS